MVLRFRSVKSIVIAPASTGSDNNSRTAVTKIDQTNKFERSIYNPGCLILIIVTIKLIAPIIDEAPAKCKLKMAQSTDEPHCVSIPLSGGYSVHPAPTAGSINIEISNRTSAGGNSQKLKLFKRGNAISGAPSINGTNQLPKPPIKIGITIKKIIVKACAVTSTLYSS